MHLIVTGSRFATDYEAIKKELDKYLPVESLAHGMAKGVDSLADRWAKENGVFVWPYEAEWALLGRVAGPVRNREMLTNQVRKYGLRNLLLLAFHEDLKNSKGTKDCVRQADHMGMDIKVVPLS